MAQQVVTDEVGVRFGIGAGVLFLLTGVTVAARLPAPWGVLLLLAATAVLAAALDRPHALGLGLVGWAFATGFAVHVLGDLTFAPHDLLRLGSFLVAATVASVPRTAV